MRDCGLTMANCPAGYEEMYVYCEGSGDPVLFLHDVPTSCHLWNRIIERMSVQFTCIAVDLPGLGRSPRSPRGFHELDALAASIEDLRVKRNIEKWHIVGHDAGCAIAVHSAHHFQERVGRLALLTPSIFPDLKPFYLFEILRKPFLGELMAPAVNLLFWNLVMRRALDGNLNGKNDRNEIVSDFHAPFSGLRGAWRLMSLLRWGDPAEVLASIPAFLPELLAPTLIFHGTRDSAVPQAFATRCRPHSRFRSDPSRLRTLSSHDRTESHRHRVAPLLR